MTLPNNDMGLREISPEPPLPPEPPDFTCIESTLVRVVIAKAMTYCPCDYRYERNESELGKALTNARVAGVLGEVLSEAVRYNVLSQVMEEVTRTPNALFSCPKPLNKELIIQVLKEVKQYKADALRFTVLKELIIQANESRLLSFVVRNCLRCNISPVKAADKCGLLSDVLREAVGCGEVLTGPVIGSVIGEILAKLKDSCCTDELAEDCRRWGVSLVKEAIKCELLTNVLGEAVLSGNIGLLLDNIRTCELGLLEEVLAEAEKSGLTTCIEREFVTTLVDNAVNRGELEELLIKVNNSESLSFVVENYHSNINSVALVKAIDKRGLWPSVLAECDRSGNLEMLINGAIKGGLLKELKTQAKKKAGLLSQVIDVLGERDLACVLMDAGKAGPKAVDDVLWVIGVYDPFDGVMSTSIYDKELLGRHISCAYLAGRLRKTLAVLSRSNINREEILEVAKDHDMLKDILEAERLNGVFEVVGAIIACLLLLCIIISGKTTTSSHCSSEHRKCITDHVTLCSGDVERNPGPVFFFNDWLKEMFALSVRVVHRIEGRRIPWKKLDRPDPSNSKFDRRGLRSLFDEALLQSAAIRIPSTHVEEFLLLTSYIQSDREPNLDRLEELVEIRKLKVTLTESVKQLKSLPPSRQPEIIDFLERGQGYTLSITETRQNDDTSDREPEDEEGMEAGEHQEMSREDQAVNKDDNCQMEDDSGPSEQQPRASIEDQISDGECPLESDEEAVAGPSGSQSPLLDDYSQGMTNFSQTEDGVHSPNDQLPGSSGHLSHNQFDVPGPSAAQSPLPDDYSQGKTNFSQTEEDDVHSPSDQILGSSGHLSLNQDDVPGPSAAQSSLPNDECLQQQMAEELLNDISDIIAKEGFSVDPDTMTQHDDREEQTTDLLEQALDQHHSPDNTDNIENHGDLNQSNTGDNQVGSVDLNVMVSAEQTSRGWSTDSSAQLQQATITKPFSTDRQLEILVKNLETWTGMNNLGTKVYSAEDFKVQCGLSKKRPRSGDPSQENNLIAKRAKI